MKLAVLSLTLFTLLAAVSAIPAQQDVLPGYSMLVQEPEDDFPSENGAAIENIERSDRHRRATCDLLSFSTKFGSINHAACAAHCLAMRKGFRGGRCKDGVCHCRR